MKRFFTILLLIAGASVTCFAQSYKEAIENDPAKLAGPFCVYDAAALPAVTPAPEGYRPFYISQFARHGARYGAGCQGRTSGNSSSNEGIGDGCGFDC